MEVVDCLFRLSMSIRNSIPHDRFRKENLINTSHFEASDISHVHDIFPSAPDLVKERLGRAISRRRQFFKYRELHHNKLAHGVDDPGCTEDAGVSTMASSIPPELKFGGMTSQTAETNVLDEDGGSESSWTDTTCGFSALGLGGKKPKIPPLPKEAGDRPFECPFCYTIISATTTKAWM